MTNLVVGFAMERSWFVTPAMTAAALMEREAPGGPGLPAVWSTPDMVGKMEALSAAMVAGHLPPGQVTLGVRNEMRHLAATPVGREVRVRSTLKQIDGRQLVFSVEAHDERELVGDGTHVRVVVDAARFLDRLARKGG